jgi:hypothetical protein
MPSLITRGAISAKALGFTSAIAAISSVHFIGLLGPGSSGDAVGNSIAVDGNLNIYMCGSIGSSGFLIIKYNSVGVIQWQRKLNLASAVSIALDGNSNVYVCGYDTTVGASIITKYNSIGVIQWQKNLLNTVSLRIKADSSGNSYICGEANNSGTNNVLFAKYDTFGVIQYQKFSDIGEYGASISLDSSSNIFIGTTGIGFSTISKYNSSGVAQFGVFFSGFDLGSSIAIDSSGNIYSCEDRSLTKIDNTGAFLWGRRLVTSSGSAYPIFLTSVALDSAGNIYACGTDEVSNLGFEIFKYNSSGTLQWQRRLVTSAWTSTAFSIAIDRSDNLCILGSPTYSSAQYFLFARLPNDGSLTGTYTVGGLSFTYSAGSNTSSTFTNTETAVTPIVSTSTYTSSTATLTDSATSLTSSVKTI